MPFHFGTREIRPIFIVLEECLFGAVSLRPVVFGFDYRFCFARLEVAPILGLGKPKRRQDIFVAP